MSWLNKENQWMRLCSNTGPFHFKDYEIKRKFESFLKFYMDEYKRHKAKPGLKPNARVQFCSLQYFLKELGLE